MATLLELQQVFDNFLEFCHGLGGTTQDKIGQSLTDASGTSYSECIKTKNVKGGKKYGTGY
jgi:hypothetical protein